jgi:hypothetical protein
MACLIASTTHQDKERSIQGYSKYAMIIILHFLASSLFLYVNAFPWKPNFFQLQPHERFADFYSSFFFKLLDIFFLCIDQSDFL